MDKTTLGGHLLAANSLFERLCTKPEPTVKGKGKKKIKARTKAVTYPPTLVSLTTGTSIFGALEYDVYHHSNVPEAILLREPLQQYIGRLQELLKEFSENPILLSLEKIVYRLLDQPADSPLFQILVGVELLLRKSQLWEDNAAKHVSIKGTNAPFILVF